MAVNMLQTNSRHGALLPDPLISAILKPTQQKAQLQEMALMCGAKTKVLDNQQQQIL
jgi:hypothetical protein